MKMANENKFEINSLAEASSLDSTLKALLYGLQDVPLKPGEFEDLYAKIKSCLSSSQIRIKKETLHSLITLLETCPENIKEKFTELLEFLIAKFKDPSKFLEELLISSDEQLRKPAAIFLDVKGSLPSEKIIENFFDSEAAKILSPYLSFTRATYLDLIYLTPEPGKFPPIAQSIKNCRKICGENIIREVITKLGWKNLNYGLSVKKNVGINFNGSLPFYISEKEAILLERSVRANRVDEFFLFTAHGGLPLQSGQSAEGNKPVALFRAYNLAHAKLLQEILDVAPLTHQKVKDIIIQMDRIVDDFIKLFNSYSEECTILPEIYEKIKNKILSDLDKETSNSHLSANVTRLVQMFEDPQTIGEVHTLHGLKRYLHQKGLQLGFKLVDQSKSPNQSINIVLTTSNKILSVIKNINFANFEAGAERETPLSNIPYPIKVVADGFQRQLLHGQEGFPSLNIFCYGNEVHYFIWFRNHPVFIRIDFSPPLQGGMIDLQYFGVSNYEIADHPNIYLEAIRFFFQFLEFDVKMNGTHIQARYDKERALGLSHLCEKVELLFCLVPYLMDLDWVIGSLNLNSDAKKKISKAWAKMFARWGVLPLNKFLTKDRLGISQDVLNTPQGEYELVWSGDEEYRDQFMIRIPSGFFEKIFNSISNLKLSIPKFSEENFSQLGQLYLERKLFTYLREALEEGAIVETPEGFVTASEDLFQMVHEACLFAEIISEGKEEFESSVALARAVIPLEQTLKFRDTGTLENFKVQCSSLPLAGDNLNLYVLRDYQGIIRMAFYVHGNSLYQKRNDTSELWKTNAALSVFEFISLLRYNNYNVKGLESSAAFISEEIEKVKEELLVHTRPALQIRPAGEKIVNGLRASPGRATGRVLLGTEGRLPEDFNDHIFVAASVSPDENTILFHSAGIVATGGGILSHAGLIATQFNKPAIIISGTWERESDGSLILVYKISEYRVKQKVVKGISITFYYDMHEREYEMQDGDLVVLDANEGSLQVLGQERDTIALFEELKSLGRTNQNISGVDDVKELLFLRGKKLHIRYQVEKLLKRTAEPQLAKYAVQEIMTGNFLDGSKSTPEERAHLLRLILDNDKVGNFAENYILQTAVEVENKLIFTCAKAEKNIPLAKYPFEVVMPRLEVLRIYETMYGIISSISPEQLKKIKLEKSDISNINIISFHRLKEIRSKLVERISQYLNHTEKRENIRHLFRQLNRIDLLLNTPEEEKIKIAEIKESFEIDDKIICSKLTDKFILKPGEGALELISLMGCKAANLSELEMLGGEGLVPSWFVITDKAFQTALETPIRKNFSVSGENLPGSISLREAINKIILKTDINNREKSLHIRNLWSMISLPGDLKKEILKAYHHLQKIFSSESEAKEKEQGFYVALRSSSCEEDAEVAARAGEFETYLFITGEELLFEYLKKTWSGLWTERAIHNRTVLGNQEVGTKGGVIVQRIVWSRVSGVLQTINVAKSDLSEIVINAGLGLGEGVVSGAVAADHIIVSKEGDLEKGPLHFNYITADKTEQVLFNKRAGYGTVLTSTLYHQRFRPALEYVELCELVSIASRLEAAYGYPLDMEFGIEETKLWILQVRPVATFLPAFRETLNHYPLFERNNSTTKEISK